MLAALAACPEAAPGGWADAGKAGESAGGARPRADGVQRAVPDDQVPARGAAAALVPPGAAADGHGGCARVLAGRAAAAAAEGT